jgi:hypothetical protein
MKHSDQVVGARVAKDNRGSWALAIGDPGGAENRLELGSINVDFSEFDPDLSQSHCEREWMHVELPGFVAFVGATEDGCR